MTLLLTAISLVLAFTVQSAFGFGAAILSIPMLALLLPLTQITPLIVMLTMTLSTIIVWQSWRSIDTAILWRLLLTACLGIPIGVSFLVFVNEGVVKMTLGAIVLAASLNMLLSLTPSKPMPAFAVWPYGFVIGILGGAYSLIGIPLIMVLRWARLQAEAFRATVHALTLTISIAILACYGGGGLLSKATLTNYAIGLPPMLFGGWLGSVLVTKVREDQFQKIIALLLMIMSTALILSGYQSL